MKKILLSLMLVGAFTIGKAQLVLNEIYPDPSIPPNEEYIELFNTTPNPVPLGCYTIVTYSPGSPSILWVYDVPDYLLPAFGFAVYASDIPINYQGHTGAANSQPGYSGLNAFSWNANNNALTKYTISGTTLTSAPVTYPVTDLIPITGGPSTTMNVMVFDGSGNLVSGFFANNSHSVPAEVVNLGDKAIGTCSGNILHFGQAATNSEVLDLNQAPGNDNGYYRKNNGFCGSWEKASNQASLSPGTSNGTASGDQNLITVSALPSCYTRIDGTNHNGITTWTISITVTQANLLNAYFYVYEDRNENVGDIPDAGDLPVDTSGIISSTNTVTFKRELTAWRDIYIQVIPNSNCISRSVHLASGCAALPIKLKSFNAKRTNRTIVDLTWETEIEDHNLGFYVDRKLANGAWQEVTFIDSKAAGGNSTTPLSYTLSDINDSKGISQYRLRQVDIGGKQSYSVIRSVRGEGQKANMIVYPNPSGDGKVNVIFDDAKGTRDVSVTDITGRMIKQMKGVTSNNIQIDNLNAGFYTVRVMNTETGEQEVQKFVVNKR